jgi:hypothetical protein
VARRYSTPDTLERQGTNSIIIMKTTTEKDDKLDGMKLLKMLFQCHGKITSIRQLAFLVSAGLEPGISGPDIKRITKMTTTGVRVTANHLIDTGYIKGVRDIGPRVPGERNHIVVRRYWLTTKGNQLILSLYS